MRKIKEVLRLKLFVGRSCRQISKSCGIARSTVTDYLNRTARAGLSWPLPEEMDEAKLERMLYPPLPVVAPENRPKPNWPKLYCFSLNSPLAEYVNSDIEKFQFTLNQNITKN